MDRTTPDPTWRRLSRKTAYSGRVTINEYAVKLGTGERGLYEVDESFPFAVATMIIHEGAILLTRQYRFPLDRWIFDLPGGAGEPGESPTAAAARECIEETGLEPRTLAPVHSFYNNPGRTAWPVHVFLCDASAAAEPERDDWEVVQTVWTPLPELARMIRAGEIVDPSLLVGYLMATERGLLSTQGLAC